MSNAQLLTAEAPRTTLAQCESPTVCRHLPAYLRGLSDASLAKLQCPWPASEYLNRERLRRAGQLPDCYDHDRT